MQRKNRDAIRSHEGMISPVTAVKQVRHIYKGQGLERGPSAAPRSFLFYRPPLVPLFAVQLQCYSPETSSQRSSPSQPSVSPDPRSSARNAGGWATFIYATVKHSQRSPNPVNCSPSTRTYAPILLTCSTVLSPLSGLILVSDVPSSREFGFLSVVFVLTKTI